MYVTYNNVQTFSKSVMNILMVGFNFFHTLFLVNIYIIMMTTGMADLWEVWLVGRCDGSSRSDVDNSRLNTTCGPYIFHISYVCSIRINNYIP